MIGCLRTRVRKQPIIALYFEFETVLRFYNLEAWFCDSFVSFLVSQPCCRERERERKRERERERERERGMSTLLYSDL